MSKILNEGGNIFKGPAGGSETIRIKREDVDPTLEWLEGILGIDLVDYKLGTTGRKETSGDLDIAIDQSKVSKDDLIKKLMAWLNENHPELELAKSNAKELKQKIRQWIAKSGTSVHFKTPIRGDEANGFVQTDLMFGDPEFMLWAVKGEMGPSEYRGGDRQNLINAIATQLGYAWSAFFGLKNRETGERITDPQKVVQTVLGPGHKPEDFDSIYTLFDILKDKSDYPDEVYNAIRAKAGFEFPHRDEALDEAKKIEPRIQHAEDLIFFEGSEGAIRALDALEKMNDPEGRPETSLKWDGSPAVIFGRDADGKFIFTDKSGFGVKSYKGKVESEQEMEGMYRARAERAAKKMGMTADEVFEKRYSQITPMMQKAFRLAEKSVDPEYRGYFFGEVLYFDKPAVEDGKFVFKPNMVKYKVATNSEIGKKIADSDVGIVLHLKKDVETLENQPLDFEGMTPDSDILFFGKTFIEKPVGVDDAEVAKIKQMVSTNSQAIDEFFNADKLRKFAISDLPNLFYTYLNSKVDTGLENLGGDFIDWLNSKDRISSQKKENVANYINDNKNIFDIIWQIVSRTMKVKDDVIANIDSQGGLEFSQSLGDEEVGEGYVLSDEGKLIKLVDRSKFTRANRSVVREQDELDPDYDDDLADQIADIADVETHVFIPGGFKPPHKGHLSLLLQAIQKYPDAIVHITSGPTKRAAGDLEISAEQAKQVWEKYIEKYGINNEVELDYFDRFATNRKKKDGSVITSSSPFLRIGLRMENELDPNSKVVAVSSEDEHINFVKNAATYLNDKKEKNFTFEPLKAGKIEVEPGVKFSATQMRKAISEGDFDTFKAFMPEKLSEDEAKEVFELLGGGLDEASAMGGGAVAGYSLPFTSGKKRRQQTIYREQLRQVIKHLVIKERDQMLNEEKQLRELIRQIIKENDTPTKSTGLNKLVQALKIILPTVESGYKSLTTDKEQRDSFKQHYLKAIIDTLSPQDAIRSASGGEASAMLGGSALEEQEKIEVNVTDEETPEADLSDEIEGEETDVAAQIRKDAGVTLKDIEGKKTDIPLPQIPGLDETGRDESVDVYKKTVDAITRNYRTLHNENDREEFKEYLITNLLLYFDKFENDISPELRPVTTPEYEKQKAEKDQFIAQGAETVSEEIKKAIKETLKNSLFQ
jgi:hypothetical protein